MASKWLIGIIAFLSFGAQSFAQPQAETLTEAQRADLQARAESLERVAYQDRCQRYFDSATDKYQEVLSIQRRVYGKDDWRCASTGRHLEDMRAEQALDTREFAELRELRRHIGLINEAEATHKHAVVVKLAPPAIAIADRLFGGQHWLCIKPRMSIGSALNRSGEFERAASFLKEALILIEKQLPAKHMTRVTILSELCVAERLSGDRANSRLHQLAAIEQLQGEIDPRMVGVYSGLRYELALQSCENAQWNDALAHCDAAIRVNAGVDEPDDNLYAILLLKSMVLHWMGEFERSHSGFREVLRHLGPPEMAELIASVNGAISRQFIDVGDLQTASKYAHAARREAPLVFRPSDRYAKASCDYLDGWLLLRNEQYEKAAESYRQGALVLQPLGTSGGNIFYFPMLELGRALTEMGLLEKAEYFLPEKVDVEEGGLKVDLLEAETRKLLLANLRLKQGRMKEANVLIADDLAVMYQFFGKEHPRNRPFLALRAKVLRACDRVEEAERMEAIVTRIDAKLPEIRARLAEIAKEEDAKDAAAVLEAANSDNRRK